MKIEARDGTRYTMREVEMIGRYRPDLQEARELHKSNLRLAAEARAQKRAEVRATYTPFPQEMHRPTRVWRLP